MRRGEIWWADLGQPRGSAPGLRRPVLVVQDDLLTQSALATVMIIPLTTNLRRAQAVGNILLEPKDSGLDRASVALVCRVMTIDKHDLTEIVGSLSTRKRQAIDAGLKVALGLR